MLAAFTNLIFFVLLVVGLGAALASDWRLKASERLCLGIAAALLGLYAVGFGLFVTGTSPAWLWILPPATAGLMFWRRRKILVLCRDPEARSLLGLWAVFVLWTLGLLALVGSYSGGGWAGDWWEHYMRTLVFMQLESPHMHFLGSYTLTSRPPLANVVTALFMELSGGRFSDYQMFTTLLSTLFFFPGWLFYQRWKTARSSNVLWVIILMLNPLVAQNTTFAWTKLICTFWVLSGSYFLLRGILNELGRGERIIGFLCLTAGLLTHYSTGPWILAWLIAYGIWGLRQARPQYPVREAFIIGGLCASLAFTWFGWAAYTFGWHDTGTSNSAAQEWQLQTARDHWLTPINNIVNTIVPHPFREMDRDFIYQLSKGGWVRDYFFNIYQTNLPMAVGFGGLLVVIFTALRPSPDNKPIPIPEMRLWRWFLPFVIVTGIIVATAPEDWGLAHICLQPLVIIGLAWIATKLPQLSPMARAMFIVFALWDVGVGIALHFTIESTIIYDNGVNVISGWGFEVTRLSRVAMLNYLTKTVHKADFLGDTLGVPSLLIAAGLLVLLSTMVIRLRRKAGLTPSSFDAHR